MNNLVLATNATDSLALPGEQASERRTYLSFQIDETLSAVLDMDEVHEVLSIAPAQLTPVFNMPACVLGLLTRRSRAIWAVDLSQLLLSDSVLSQGACSSLPKAYSVIVIRVVPPWLERASLGFQGGGEQVLFGLVVRSVKGSVSLASNAIQAPQGHFSASFAPCLRGTALCDRTLFHVLSGDAIARSAHLMAV